jgi:DNA-binding GntR family transcriptional regulator
LDRDKDRRVFRLALLEQIGHIVAAQGVEFINHQDHLALGVFAEGEILEVFNQKVQKTFPGIPLREALRWLERDGVVGIEKHKGASVTRLTAQRVSDIYEFRARLEGFAANLAAERSAPADHALMVAANKAFSDAITSESKDRIQLISETNRQIHREIASASKNAFLASALGQTTDNPLVVRTYSKLNKIELQRSETFHDLIVEAIVAGEGAPAERLMIEHVLQARDSLIVEFE